MQGVGRIAKCIMSHKLVNAVIYVVTATGYVVNNDVISWVYILYVNFLLRLFNNHNMVSKVG